MALIEEFRLVSYLSRWEHAVRYPLSSSYPESLTVGDLLGHATDADREALFHAPLDYMPIRGSARLRRAIAAIYDTLDADDVIGFAGADEAINAAAQALLEPADHAIVTLPAYQSLESLPAATCAVTAVPLDPDDGWHLDPDRIRDAVRPNTRVLILNAPHNPTGTLPSRATFDAVVALCRQHGLWLLCDEVYRGLEYDPAARLPQVADIYERGVSLNVMSKAYGLPGLRIGWLATKAPALLHRLERAKQYLSICNSNPGETLAAVALDARHAILGAVMARSSPNLGLLDAVLRAHPGRFDWTPPQAGVLGFPRYTGPDGAEAFAATLVRDTGILVVPSTVYRSALGHVPADRLRIGFGRALAEEALQRLEAWLADGERC